MGCCGVVCKGKAACLRKAPLRVSNPARSASYRRHFRTSGSSAARVASALRSGTKPSIPNVAETLTNSYCNLAPMGSHPRRKVKQTLDSSFLIPYSLGLSRAGQHGLRPSQAPPPLDAPPTLYHYRERSNCLEAWMKPETQDPSVTIRFFRPRRRKQVPG